MTASVEVRLCGYEKDLSQCVLTGVEVCGRWTASFVPLHRIKFIDDLGTVTTIDGDTYQAEPAAIAAIMPKPAKRSKLGEWFKRTF